MLDQVTPEHFRPLLGSTQVLQLDDGRQLQINIDSVDEKPMARMRDDSRMPFSVAVSSLQPSDFIDGLCTLELSTTGTLKNLFVSRVPPMGRNDQLAYYHISFN